MGLPNKDENVLNLFFNEPSKQWHFTDIVKNAGVSRQQASKWLRHFTKEKLILRIKPKGRMPYFISNFGHPNYELKKRLFALGKLYESGFLAHLQSLPDAEAVVVFGSFVRGDWNSDSDIDVFILGDPAGLQTATYWRKMHRQIEPHIFSSLEEVKAIRSGLMKNVLQGFVVKGNIAKIMEAI